jgi:hypothetical protein
MNPLSHVDPYITRNKHFFKGIPKGIHLWNLWKRRMEIPHHSLTETRDVRSVCSTKPYHLQDSGISFAASAILRPWGALVFDALLLLLSLLLAGG